MSTVAIIPARRGSKRFPGKNVALLQGKPLIGYSIEYAIEQGDIIDEVIVTTNDPKVKEVASQYDITLIDRPDEISGDKATTVSALQHVLNTAKSSFENIILLQPTNPLRPSGLLSEAYEVFAHGNHDSLMSVTRNHQKFGKISKGRFLPFNYEMGQRSQDLEPLYFENGLIYISKSSLIESGNILGENNHPFVTEHPFSWIDIDVPEDLDRAEYALNRYYKQNNP